MASLKFYLVASVLVAVAAADVLHSQQTADADAGSAIPINHLLNANANANVDINAKTVDAGFSSPIVHADANANGHRDKKDVLLSTFTYPYVQPAVPLLKTTSPVIHPYYRTVSPVNYIHPYYRTAYPYSYYPYSYYPYSYYPYTYNYKDNVAYLKK